MTTRINNHIFNNLISKISDALYPIRWRKSDDEQIITIRYVYLSSHIALFGALSTIIPLVFTANIGDPRVAIYTFSIGITLFLVHRNLLRGNYRAGLLSFVVIVCVAGISNIISSGGFGSYRTVYILIPLIITGLLGIRWGLYSFAFCLIASVPILIAEYAGLLPPTRPDPPLMYWMLQSITTACIIVIVHARLLHISTLRNQVEKLYLNLQQSEQHYRRTVEVMSEGIVVFGADGNLQICNPAGQRILGLHKEHLIGMQPPEAGWYAIHEDGTPFPLDTLPVFTTLKTGQQQSSVIMGIHKPDNSMTWVSMNSQPLHNQQDNTLYAVVMTFSDITDRKQGEENLRTALIQEKELGELKSRFVSIASHEFRTPLSGILLATDMLIKFGERLDRNQINAKLERIREKVIFMEDIMNDVLQLARFQAGRVDFKPAEGRFDAVCRDVIEEFSARQQDAARIIAEFDPAPITSIFDRNLMRRTITNLISNALKYSDDKPISIRIQRKDQHIILQISDQGIGIPAGDMKHLFEPFHRASNIGSIQGTGLGLSIVKQAIDLHNGTIKVESEINVGTTFTITLPMPVTLAATKSGSPQMIQP